MERLQYLSELRKYKRSGDYSPQVSVGKNRTMDLPSSEQFLQCQVLHPGISFQPLLQGWHHPLLGVCPGGRDRVPSGANKELGVFVLGI